MESKGFFRGSIGCSVTVIFQLAVSPISFAGHRHCKTKERYRHLVGCLGTSSISSWNSSEFVPNKWNSSWNGTQQKRLKQHPLDFFPVETLITSSPWVMQQRETKGKWDCWHAETAAVGWTESREGPKSWEMKGRRASDRTNWAMKERFLVV